MYGELSEQVIPNKYKDFKLLNVVSRPAAGPAALSKSNPRSFRKRLCCRALSPIATKRRINTSNRNSRHHYSKQPCAAPAVYASPHQKSLSSKGSANLTAFYLLASMSFGARANSMLEAFLSVSVTNRQSTHQVFLHY